MGIMYEKGKFSVQRLYSRHAEEIEQPFIEKNLKKAIECYEKAAELGLMQAKVHLANMHFLGLGVPKNLKKAREMYQEILDAPKTPMATLESSDEEIEAYRKSLFNRRKVEKILKFIELQ